MSFWEENDDCSAIDIDSMHHFFHISVDGKLPGILLGLVCAILLGVS